MIVYAYQHRMKALITGSGGLIGSECARTLLQEGWQVIGIDNDMRREFFGPQGTTRPVVEHLLRSLAPTATRNLISATARKFAICSNRNTLTSSFTPPPSPR